MSFIPRSFIGVPLYGYAVFIASVVMYEQCIGTWCITCFITFDDLSGHSYSPTF